MSDATITSDNVFEVGNEEFAESAYDAAGELFSEAVLAAVGFSSLLSEILTDDQKAQLSPWDRAALENLTELSDEVGLEVVGAKLRSND